jgi:hypothetical protein
MKIGEMKYRAFDLMFQLHRDNSPRAQVGGE